MIKVADVDPSGQVIVVETTDSPLRDPKGDVCGIVMSMVTKDLVAVYLEEYTGVTQVRRIFAGRMMRTGDGPNEIPAEFRT